MSVGQMLAFRHALIVFGSLWLVVDVGLIVLGLTNYRDWGDRVFPWLLGSLLKNIYRPSFRIGCTLSVVGSAVLTVVIIIAAASDIYPGAS